MKTEKLLELLLRDSGCLRRFYDQVFRAFAAGPQDECQFMWMTQADFIGFCTRCGAVDTYSLTDDKIASATQELDIAYSSVTTQKGHPVS